MTFLIIGHVPPSGFDNPSLARVLYRLGPECASSNEQAVRDVVGRGHFGRTEDTGRGDTSVISSNPVTEEELQLLMKVGGCVCVCVCVSVCVSV